MKKMLLPVIASVALGLSGCSIGECGPFTQPKLKGIESRVELPIGNNYTPVVSDLRLVLKLNVEHIYAARSVAPFSLIPVARACSPVVGGFVDPIEEISLTCDTAIGGFPAGKNILAPGATVEWIGLHDKVKPITLKQWTDAVNLGERASWGGNSSVVVDYTMWRNAYNVSIHLFPKNTDTQSGVYGFTLAVRLKNGALFRTVFAPVTFFKEQ